MTLPHRSFTRLASGLATLLAVGLTLHLSARPAAADDSPPRPNVVLFLVDDYGYGDIGIEGNTQIATPNIDRIAQEGTRFTRFYQSAAACAPTRAALLTGRHFYEAGVWGVHWGRDFLHRDEHTLGDLLQGAGYRTGVFGKWHSGKTDAYFGWSRGFDTSVHNTLYEYWDTRVLADRKLVHVDGPITDVVGERAVAFMRENRHRPFFCYVPFQAIHEPFNAPPDLFAKYKARGYSDHVARLYGMIETLDRNVGRVLDYLDEAGLTEQTLVLFMVDDGASPGFDLTYQTRRMIPAERAERERAWPRRLRDTKAGIGEGGQISPFYVRWPGQVPAGREVDLLSGVIDIYPTLVDLCEAPLPEGQLPLRGRSLASTLLGGEQDFSDRVYFDGTNLYLIERAASFEDGVPRIRQLSAHYRNFKYIRIDRFLLDGTDEVRHLLYDLAADPAERNNIAAENPEMTTFLREKTEAWFDGIVASGRAFLEAAYAVGSWSEVGTPINLDSTTRIEGVERDPGPGFHFTGWDRPGDALTYNLEVLEAGRYEVELNYTLAGSPTGAVFAVRGGEASARATIDQPERAVSMPLELEAGPAKLEIRLEDLNGRDEAIEWLDLLVVRRLPDGEAGMPAARGFTVKLPDGATLQAGPSAETKEFMRYSEPDVHALPSNRLLPVRLLTDHPESVARWEVWMGFEQIASSDNPEATLWIRPGAVGRDTLNVVWHARNGAVQSARLEIRAE